MDAGFVGVFVLVLLLYLGMIGISVADYVMQSLALYTIADRRQIKNPWLAWIPYANCWLLGSLVDDYDNCRGMKRKWRVVLLVLSIVIVAGVVLMYVLVFIMAFAGALQYETGYYDYYSSDMYTGEMMGILLAVYLPLIPVALASTALQICSGICLYGVFESTVPEKAVKYLLLSLLVPLAKGICLMKCRKKGYERPKIWYYTLPPDYMPAAQPAASSVAAEEPAAEEGASPEREPEPPTES